MPDTPLGQIVSIRAEKDPEMLKCFNAGQKRIHNEWQSRMAKQMSDSEYNRAMADFSSIFRGMTGGGH